MTIVEHANIQMTSALAAVTAPAPPTKRKMYAHQLVNELEESEYITPSCTHLRSHALQSMPAFATARRRRHPRWRSESSTRVVAHLALGCDNGWPART